MDEVIDSIITAMNKIKNEYHMLNEERRKFLQADLFEIDETLQGWIE